TTTGVLRSRITSVAFPRMEEPRRASCVRGRPTARVTCHWRWRAASLRDASRNYFTRGASESKVSPVHSRPVGPRGAKELSATSTYPPETLERLAAAGLDPERLPRHVAVIMDGNGRWAQQR